MEKYGFAYDLIKNCYVRLDKNVYINNKDRYCGTTSKRIPRLYYYGSNFR